MLRVAFLDKLPHGVQIRREINGGRIDSLVVLAFAFAVKLLPPFRDEMKGQARSSRESPSSCLCGTGVAKAAYW